MKTVFHGMEAMKPVSKICLASYRCFRKQKLDMSKASRLLKGGTPNSWYCADWFHAEGNALDFGNSR